MTRSCLASGLTDVDWRQRVEGLRRGAASAHWRGRLAETRFNCHWLPYTGLQSRTYP